MNAKTIEDMMLDAVQYITTNAVKTSAHSFIHNDILERGVFG
jgi:hypothetical protein